jgi:hypothetical protein
MVEGYLPMSSKEVERACLVRQTVERRLGQREAAEHLGVSVRQFKRLVRSWRLLGDAGLISRQRGRASNNQLSMKNRKHDIFSVYRLLGDLGICSCEARQIEVVLRLP